MTSPSWNRTNISTSAENGNWCPPKPDPKLHGMVKLRSVGIIIDCFNYGVTDKNDTFVIPPEQKDKLQLALLADSNVYLDLRDGFSQISIYSKVAGNEE